MAGVAWLLLDLRHAVRQLHVRPGFTLAALIILSVGIGANTAAFSLVHGLLLRPLPFPDSENIVSVGQASPVGRGASMLSSAQLLHLWDEARSFEQLAAYSPLPVVLDSPDGPVNLFGAAVSPSFFPLLRAAPQRGRLFTDADAVEGAHRIVLLNHSTWMNRFGSDPDIVGAPVGLNGEPHTVVGVLPAGFEFERAEIWTPFVVRPDQEPVDGGLFIEGATLGIGRLRPEVSPEQAATEVRTILDRPRPDDAGRWISTFGTRVISLREEMGRPFRPALLMLTAATGLVLLMACANVAGLLLARGIVRRRELAIRGALGAGRGRIVRQLLTESVVLSVGGGAAGLAVTAAIMLAAPALVPRSVPGLADAGVDGTVLAFAAGLSIVAGLVFGTVPALAWSRVDLVRVLNDASATAGDGFGRLGTNKAQALLATGQVALAIVFLTGAGLLLRSFVALVTLDLGFDPTNVVITRTVDPAIGRIFGAGGQLGPDELEAMNAREQRFTQTLLMQMERVRNLPGVEAVALASQMPFGVDGARPLHVVGRPAPSEPQERLMAGIRMVSPGYTEVVRLRVLAGRFFTERDTAGSPRVAVVSEAFAREAFGGEPAVGQRLAQWRPFPFPDARRGNDGRDDETWEVVGVVADVRSPLSPASSFMSSTAGGVYLSLLQPGMDRMPSFNLPGVIVRTASEPLAVVPFLREVLADVSPGAIVNATALDDVLLSLAAQPRFYAVCAGIFGTVALLLAAFGLYSLLSYTVSQRRREIGVRMALGAGSRAVLMLVVRQGGVLVGAGVAIGLPAAAAATRIVESLLFGVTPADPPTIAAVTTILLAVGFIACWLPARRAARIDPMDVLREA